MEKLKKFDVIALPLFCVKDNNFEESELYELFAILLFIQLFKKATT